MECSIADCSRLARRRSWCRMHYQRWWVYGDPLFTKRPELHLTVEQRFLLKVRKRQDGCWEWTGTRTVKGYGMFRIGGRMVPAHRWAYGNWVGPIPKGQVLDHFVCDFRACVNPEHVRPVSNRENTLRGNTITAWALAQTHCKHGHEFTEANTYYWKGGRFCRKCHHRRNQKYRQRKRQRV